MDHEIWGSVGGSFGTAGIERFWLALSMVLDGPGWSWLLRYLLSAGQRGGGVGGAGAYAGQLWRSPLVGPRKTFSCPFPQGEMPSCLINSYPQFVSGLSSQMFHS